MSDQLCLGGFVFSVKNRSAYSVLSYVLTSGWQQTKGLGRPFSYLTAPPLRTLNLSGEVYGKDASDVLQGLYDRALSPKPLKLSDHSGMDLGFWVITSIKETHSQIKIDGVPFVRKFDLNLREFANASDNR